MTQREALRLMRSEIGMTQSELANELNVSFSTVNRWENQDARPNKAISLAILALAKTHFVTAVCLDALTRILLASRANDRSDKEKIDEVTQRLKLEERVILTAEQMKAALDNMDLAVIGHRIFHTNPKEPELFYFNRRYAEIFGYSEDEFHCRSKGNTFFALPKESVTLYQTQLQRLLDGAIDITALKLTARAFRRDDEEIWLEIKGVSLSCFSYGWELLISCRDVTKRVEAERRYAEEVVVRDASLQGFYASLHCDLETNVIFRQRGIEKVTGEKANGESFDGVCDRLARSIPSGEGQRAFRQRFNRRQLLAAFERGKGVDCVTAFNTVARRYMRIDHVILQNPHTEHMEAAIYLYDIHEQVLSAKLIRILSERFFEYIGVIDNEKESLENFFSIESVFETAMPDMRDYPSACVEKLKLFGDPSEAEAVRQAISLTTIRRELQYKDLYSTFINLRGYDGQIRRKKVSYTYVDETHSMIAMAQSDTADISRTVSEGLTAPDRMQGKRSVK